MQRSLVGSELFIRDRHLPAIVEAAATIGAAQIQNRGTLGGNIANASPAGDTLPVLLALDAAIVVGGPRGERTVSAADFWVAYRRTALAPDELVLRIRIPVAGGREARFRKVGTRRAQAISKVVLALAWRENHGAPASAWSDVRLALGSVADRPIRARATEAVLEGATPTPETADAAAESLATEIHPIDDVRSTADYRRVVAARALHRMIRDAGGW
jgi:xanthine dehydrogenase small subunit